MAKQLTAIDLFSGCGGLTQGLKDAGFFVVGALDVDRLAVESYQLNHPEVAVWEDDIESLDEAEFRRDMGLRRGELDLLAGCPPCQGFSTLKTLNGKRTVDDDRRDLIVDFLRMVDEFRPRGIMIENVPGLVKDVRGRALNKELSARGYSTDHDVLNARDFGVPQRRRRFILIGTKGTPVELALPEKSVLTVRDAIGRMAPPENSGDSLHNYRERRSDRILNIIKCIPHDGGSRKDLGSAAQLKCHQSIDGFKDVYGRMKWADVAPTITGGCINPSKGRFLHPEQDRAITLREASLLQGFPEDYKFSERAGRYAVAQMIGNALPPPFIKKHALQLLKALSN